MSTILMECSNPLGNTLALNLVLTLLIVLYLSMIRLDNYFKKWSILVNVNLGFDIIDGKYHNWPLYCKGVSVQEGRFALICVKAT